MDRDSPDCQQGLKTSRPSSVDPLFKHKGASALPFRQRRDSLSCSSSSLFFSIMQHHAAANAAENFGTTPPEPPWGPLRGPPHRRPMGLSAP
jgi:hypothetical protein